MTAHTAKTKKTETVDKKDIPSIDANNETSNM